MSDEETNPNPDHVLTSKAKGTLSPAFTKWFGWGLCAITTVTTLWGISALLSGITSQDNLTQLPATVFFQLLGLTFAIVAALIITRQPHNVVGWLLALPALASVISVFNDAYLQTLITPSSTPSFFLLLSLWLSQVSWTLLIFPVLLILLLFPTGQPLSRRWNWVVRYTIGLLALFFVMVATAQEIGPFNADWRIANPIGFIPSTVISEIFVPFWTIALGGLTLVCVVALVMRYRHSSKLEKAQIKWMVYASAMFGVVYAGLVPFGGAEDQTLLSGVLNLLFAITLLAIPISIGVAILRYRLWDIDFVINRSIVYGALTALLVALLGISLLIINGLFQNFSGGPLVAVAISAAMFGALFQPARRKLQRFVDRRFYNIQIDYNQTPAPQAANATSILKQTHFGDYQNLELIGKGGMAEIYKSIHPTLGTPVAIKVLPAHLVNDGDFRKRFIREAQIVANLQHPHIIRVFDFGEANGTHYMVMEYIGGKDLAHTIEQRERLPLSEAAPLLHSLAEALDYAHAQGLVHRDVKPSNVLLDSAQSASTPRAVLTDFGIAKILGGATRYTETGGMLGTFDYIAPEQIQGAADVTGQADIYSLGIVAYQMLTGVLPFQHQNPGALLMAHLLQPPPDPREVASDLADNIAVAVQRAMAKQPADRFATAGEFVAALM